MPHYTECVSRFNVYNSVKVILSNQEFGQISTKEVEVAKYLDFLHTIRLATEYNDENAISYDKIVRLSEVDHIYEIVKNRQDVATPLCKFMICDDLVGETKEMLRITQA